MDGNGNNIFPIHDSDFNCEEEILKELREELSMDDEMSNINFHDEFLLRFLFSRQLDMKKTRNAIKCYLNAKKNEPEMFQLPYKLKDAFNDNFIAILEDKNPINGETVLITRTGVWDPNKYSFETLTAATAVTLEVASFDPDTNFRGIIDISK